MCTQDDKFQSLQDVQIVEFEKKQLTNRGKKYKTKSSQAKAHSPIRERAQRLKIKKES